MFYFEDSDLSWEAESSVIEEGARRFGDLPITVEIRNSARVHLWYEDRFGDSFPSTTPCLRIRLDSEGEWQVYAPHGFADLFNLVVRPNPGHAPRSSYEAKARRWQGQWPALTVLPWPS
ncbi:nucleotidyltransferase family protein [Amycolatopsis sp. cg13]|uniref:nucleotidyltransferase family protein n=1 Tax=Amycolatopsis sp. cg13 TaxID=3238807 RepID=UPI0035245AAB